MNDNMNSKDKPEDSSLSESTENAKFNRANIPLTAIVFGAIALVNIFQLIKPEEKYTIPIEVQQNISNLIKAHNAQSYPLNSLQRDTALDNIISMQFDELKSSEVVSKENINQLANVRHVYSNSDSYPRDWTSETMEDILVGAQAGDMQAQKIMGKRYSFAQDNTNAIFWMEKAADQGDAEAQYLVGCLYSFCSETPDYDKARFWFEKSAAQDYAAGQGSLGVLYSSGEGVEQDYTKAVELFRKAADQGYGEAQYNLGLLYEQGNGVVKSDAMAVRYFDMASAQGFGLAQDSLGWMYREGRGVKQDVKRALTLFLMAADNKVPAASNAAGWIYVEGEGVNQDYEKAANLFRRAAEAGYAKSQYSLGWLYENGHGLKQDMVEAYAWMDVAVKNGFESGQPDLERVTHLLKTGQTAEARNKARDYLERYGKQAVR